MTFSKFTENNSTSIPGRSRCNITAIMLKLIMQHNRNYVVVDSKCLTDIKNGLNSKQKNLDIFILLPSLGGGHV